MKPFQKSTLFDDLNHWAGSTYNLARDNRRDLTDAEREIINAAADIIKRAANMVFDRELREHNRATPSLQE